MTPQVLAGKVGVVFGVANKRSIAWAIAKAWAETGAKLIFNYQGERLKENVEELVSEVVPFDETQASLAITAFGRFGKGMGHRAQLNFGDCAVYALAEPRGEPVLATGNDFMATDLPCFRL
jgi:uncharacterized protein with PIN domain